MVLGKVSDFLIKHQRLLTYLSIFAALMLLMRLVYDDVLIDHDNPIVLAIFIGILVLWTLASYLNRRQHMLSHFILQSSKLINVYAVDLDYRFIAVNKNDIRLMEEIFYFTPKIGDFPMNYLNSEDAARLKQMLIVRKRVKHLYLWILLRQATKRFTGKICILPFITIAKK